MKATLAHFQSSDVSRNPTRAFSAAEQAPILLTRRDGEDLVLMSGREAEAQAALFDFAAQLIAVTTDDNGSLVERMADRFPWMLALSGADQKQCAADLVQSARASFATRQPHLALAELAAWRESATAIAEGLDRLPVTWLDEALPVARPA